MFGSQLKDIKYSWNVSRTIWSDLKILKHMRSQIFYLCENLRISSKGSMDLRGKCVLWSLKPFFVIAAFCTKVCSLTHRIKWGIWNEKSNCILPSSLAKKKLCPYKSCCIVLVTHIQFPNTFSFELISKYCNAGLLAWK